MLAVGLVLAQELEVEGDLKVTGTVESTTIDSLEEVIANMQAEIVELQDGGGWETRAFDYDFNLECGSGVFHDVSLDVLQSIQYGILNVVSIQNLSSPNYPIGEWRRIHLYSVNGTENYFSIWNTVDNYYWEYYYGDMTEIILNPAGENHFNWGDNMMLRIAFVDCIEPENISGKFKFLITAQFPD